MTASVSPFCMSTMVPYWSKRRALISRLRTSGRSMGGARDAVGGVVAGTLAGTRREANWLSGRSLRRKWVSRTRERPLGSSRQGPYRGRCASLWHPGERIGHAASSSAGAYDSRRSDFLALRRSPQARPGSLQSPPTRRPRSRRCSRGDAGARTASGSARRSSVAAGLRHRSPTSTSLRTRCRRRGAAGSSTIPSIIPCRRRTEAAQPAAARVRRASAVAGSAG